MQLDERVMIPDRIRVDLSPNYLLLKENLGQVSYLEGVCSAYFKKENQNSADVHLKQVNRNGKKWFIVLNDNYLGSPSNRIYKDVQLSTRMPFLLKVEFNFIEFLLSQVCSRSDFDLDYHKDIRVHNPNYISNQDWKNWDSKLVRQLIESSPSILKDLTHRVWNELFPDCHLVVRHITIKHLEFNKDIFVGSNNSLDVMLKLVDFVSSDRGRSYQHRLAAYAKKAYRADNLKYKQLGDPSIVDNGRDLSVKFNIDQGLWLKFYRKTKDHIRCEVGFEYPYIKRRCGKFAFDYVYPKLRSDAKSLFKKAAPAAIIEYVTRSPSGFNLADSFSTVKSFFDQFDPDLYDIADHIRLERPVTDKRLITRIKRDSRLSKIFTSKRVRLSDSTFMAYFYDPYNRIRKQKIDEHYSSGFDSQFFDKPTYKEWKYGDLEPQIVSPSSVESDFNPLAKRVNLRVKNGKVVEI